VHDFHGDGLPAWRADLEGCGAAGAGVELSDLVASGVETDLQAVDFTEPAFGAGFGDAVDEVVVDLDEPGALGGIWP
jgi:hypothetical protein